MVISINNDNRSVKNSKVVVNCDKSENIDVNYVIVADEIYTMVVKQINFTEDGDTVELIYVKQN